MTNGQAAPSGTSLAQLWASLMFLGVGWNLMFVTSTSLLATIANPAKRARAQAIRETSIWVVVTFSALSAGGVLAKAGWSTVDLIVLPLLLIPMVTTLEYALSKRTCPAAA